MTVDETDLRLAAHFGSELRRAHVNLVGVILAASALHGFALVFPVVAMVVANHRREDER